MKHLWSIILSFFIILGILFLIIVFRMVWFPPSSMGMIMGRHMMFQHMFYMFSQSIGIFMIIIGLIIVVWMIKNIKKK
jgi:ABC-type transport system involved in multi-copper enzyme maturation permease subunit